MAPALIYARSRNYCIGLNGALPWDLPDEYDFFERITTGHAVIMGRRTYEDHESALPDRLNIVVSRSRSDFDDGVQVAATLAGAIEIARRQHRSAFVIGGAGLLAEALPAADRVFESVIDAEIDGDTFIERFDFSDWETEVLCTHPANAHHAFAFETRLHRRP